jgi:hypothetical protein
MKRLFIAVLFLVLLFSPTFSYASSTDDAYKSAMLKLIELLTEQIRVLQLELSAKQSLINQGAVLGVNVRPISITSVDELMPSQFYDGAYTGLYVTDGSRLIPVGSTNTRTLHTKLWERFTKLAGNAFTQTYMQEFRTYSSRDSKYDAFVDLDSARGGWILGVNVYGLDYTDQSQIQEMDQLFIHELGHIIVDNNPYMLEAFTQMFWNTEDTRHAARVAEIFDTEERDDAVIDYYTAHTDTFVTEYAATSPLEDTVESFTVFVTSVTRGGDEVKDKKVNFFATYSKVEEMRAQIRSAL